MRLSRTGACLVIAGVYLVLRMALPFIRPTHFTVLVAFLAVAVPMLVQLALVVSVAGLKISVRSTLLLGLASTALFVGMLMLNRHVAQTASYAIVLGAVKDLLLMLAAGFIGCIAGLMVREPNIVLPIAVFSGLVDYWTVTLGPLSHILETKPSVISAVAVHMPTPIPGVPFVMIGVGDFVFLALFFSVLFRLGMNVKGSFWLGYALLTSAMYVVLVFGGALPALLPMGIAIIGANRKSFHLGREEQLAMVYVGALLLAFLVMSGVFWFRK